MKTQPVGGKHACCWRSIIVGYARTQKVSLSIDTVFAFSLWIEHRSACRIQIFSRPPHAVHGPIAVPVVAISAGLESIALPRSTRIGRAWIGIGIGGIVDSLQA